MTVPAAVLARVRGLIADESAHPPGSAFGHESFNRLCRAAARELGMDGVGITVITNGDTQGVAAASDAFCASIEDLQFGLGEGPGRDVRDTGQAVLVPDLTTGAGFRWPGYAPAVLEEGVRAVFAFPLQAGASRLGVLSLYRRRPGLLGPESVDVALGFAEVALMTLIDGEKPDRTHDRAEALGGILGHRLEVYQAQGMVQVQLGVDSGTALARLRAYAYARERSLGDVARDVLARRLALERDDRGENP
jgi:hypothetical protein